MVYQLNKKILVVTNGGGPGTSVADIIELSKLSPSLVKKLNKVLPKNWSKTNPIDMTGSATTETYSAAIKILSKKKMSVKDLIGLNLLGTFIGYKLNLFDKASLLLDDLVRLTNRSKGSVSGTLTNMVMDHWVEKVERGTYQISLLGIKELNQVLVNLKDVIESKSE